MFLGAESSRDMSDDSNVARMGTIGLEEINVPGARGTEDNLHVEMGEE